MLVEISVPLPFYLRLERPMRVPYESVCQELQIPELVGREVVVTFSRRRSHGIDNSGWTHERTTIGLRTDSASKLSDDAINKFALVNCLEIINRLILSYQCVTGQISNAGFTTAIGTSDLQLFAEICVDGVDVRDRWPGHDINTTPLSVEQEVSVLRYTARIDGLPLPQAFLVNARVALEQGQYPQAVILAATAVEVRISEFIEQRLRTAGWSDAAILPYQRRTTLGAKLDFAMTDPRSLQTYLGGVPGFSEAYAEAKKDLVPLRNRVAHHGHLPTDAEALLAVLITGRFLNVVE